MLRRRSRRVPAAQTVDEIVARSVAARGGREALAAVRTLRMTGLATAGPGRTAIVRREIARPGRIRTEFVFQGTTGVYAWDGTRGWRVSPLEGSLDARPMSAEEAAAAAEQADVDGPLVDWKKKGHRVELAGVDSLAAGPAQHLKVTMKSGTVRHVWLDAASGLVVRTLATRNVLGRTVELDTRVRRLPRDERREVPALDRDGRRGPSAAAADHGRHGGGERRARRGPLPNAALTPR